MATPTSHFAANQAKVLDILRSGIMDPEQRTAALFVQQWFQQTTERCLVRVSDPAAVSVWLPYVVGARRALVIVPDGQPRHDVIVTTTRAHPIGMAQYRNGTRPAILVYSVSEITTDNLATSALETDLVWLTARDRAKAMSEYPTDGVDLVVVVNGRHAFSNDAWLAAIERAHAAGVRLVILTEDMDSYELAEFHRQVVPGMPAYFGEPSHNDEPPAKRRHCATCCCDVD